MEDTEHSAKAHFEAARIWENVNLALGIPATIIAAVSGILAISELTALAAMTTIIVAILSGLLTFLNPSDRASKNLKAGNTYNAVRNDARIFANIKCKNYNSTDELEKQLDDLNSRRNTLNDDSPQISNWAYKKSKAAIAIGETLYKVDEQ